MFGRLTIEALPLYSAIAASGAAMVVGGALLVAIVITWLKGWLPKLMAGPGTFAAKRNEMPSSG